MPTRIDVSTIIVNWRSGEGAIRLLASLLKAGLRSSGVVIVDNDSGEREAAFLERCIVSLVGYGTDIDASAECLSIMSFLDSRVLLVRNHSNAGYAGGNNLGIRVAVQLHDPVYLLIANSDVIPAPEAVERLLSHMNRNPDTGFAAGVLVCPGDEPRVQCVGGGHHYPLFGRSSLCGKGYLLERVGSVNILGLNYLMGAFLLVRREVLDDIGPMDDRFFLYAEEIDWQWRAMKAGWKLSVCRDAIIEHRDSASTKGRGSSHLFYYYHNRAAILFNAKWFGRWFSLVSAPFVLAAAIYQARSIRHTGFAFNGILDGMRGRTGRRIGHPGP